MTPSQLAVVKKIMEALEWISGGVACDLQETTEGISPITCVKHRHGSGCKASEALTAAKAEFPEKEGGR